MFGFFENTLRATAATVTAYGAVNIIPSMLNQSYVIDERSAILLSDLTLLCGGGIYLTERIRSILIMFGSEPNLALTAATSFVAGVCWYLADCCAERDENVLRL